MIRLVCASMLIVGSAFAANAQSIAVADILTKFRAQSDQCYTQAEYGDDLESCNGMIALSCEIDNFHVIDWDVLAACAQAEAAFWDEKMNEEYLIALTLFSEADTMFGTDQPGSAVRAERLEAEQRAWIIFRDASCATSYSIQVSEAQRPTWGANCMLDMTYRRTLDLFDAKWLIKEAGVLH